MVLTPDWETTVGDTIAGQEQDVSNLKYVMEYIF